MPHGGPKQLAPQGAPLRKAPSAAIGSLAAGYGEWDAGGDHEYVQFLLLEPQVIVQDLPEVQVVEWVSVAPVPQFVDQLVLVPKIGYLTAPQVVEVLEAEQLHSQRFKWARFRDEELSPEDAPCSRCSGGFSQSLAVFSPSLNVLRNDCLVVLDGIVLFGVGIVGTAAASAATRGVGAKLQPSATPHWWIGAPMLQPTSTASLLDLPQATGRVGGT